jgi:hypothetical protein
MTDKTKNTDEVSLRAYARHRKISLSAVQKAIESGRIHKTASGKINIADADRKWASNTDMSRRPADAVVVNFPPLNEGEDDIDADAESEDLPADTSTSDYQRHRAKREEIRSRKEQIELDMLTGAVLHLADAQRMVFTAFRTIRDSVMNVPARNKDQLAAETDPMRIEALLEKELAAALASIDVTSMMKDQTRTQEETEDETS